MKKKIFMLFLFVIAIVLASCSNNTSRESVLITYEIEPKMTEEVVNKYNLSFAKTSDVLTTATSLGSLNTTEKSNEDYYTVYISKTPEATLFKYTLKADDELESHIFNRDSENKNLGRNKNKTYVSNTIYLNSLLNQAEVICKAQGIEEKYYEEELSYYKTSLLNIIMNQKVIDILYGDSSAFKNLAFTGYSFDKDLSAAFSKTTSSVYAGDAKNDGKTGIEFNIVYLPIFVVRSISGNKISSVLFLPVYETFTIGDKEIASDDNGYKLVDSKIKDIPSKDIVFDENSKAIIG